MALLPIIQAGSKKLKDSIVMRVGVVDALFG
jgi:hypothetical protein